MKRMGREGPQLSNHQLEDRHVLHSCCLETVDRYTTHLPKTVEVHGGPNCEYVREKPCKAIGEIGVC